MSVQIATEKPENDGTIMVRTTKEFKLKDRPNRGYRPFHLMREFGFVPEVVIVEKVRGSNNRFTLKAVVTDEEMAKIKKEEEKQKKALDKEIKGIEKAMKEVKGKEVKENGQNNGSEINKPGEEKGAN